MPAEFDAAAVTCSLFEAAADRDGAEQELKAAQLALVSAQRNQYVAAGQVLYVMGNLTVQTFDADAKSYDPAANFDRVKHKGWTPIEPVIEAIDNLGTMTH